MLVTVNMEHRVTSFVNRCLLSVLKPIGGDELALPSPPPGHAPCRCFTGGGGECRPLVEGGDGLATSRSGSLRREKLRERSARDAGSTVAEAPDVNCRSSSPRTPSPGPFRTTSTGSENCPITGRPFWSENSKPNAASR